MAGADYYALLGVPKNADDNAIKKGYKKMALKWHPDRNNGSEEASKKFKEISEAFEVLSDSNKRAIYDQFGEAGLKGGGPAPGAGTSSSGFPGGGFSSSGFSGASGFPGFSSTGGGFPGGSTFTFNMGSGGGGGGKGSTFSPSDPFNVFQQFMNMGGMGSSRGFSATGGLDDDDDDDMDIDGFTSFGGMPGGIPGFSSRPGPRSSSSQRPSNSRSNSTDKPNAEPPTITRPLPLTLETLHSSPSTPTTKHLKVSRRLLSGKTEDRVLDIEVQPGWKSGTKVRFRGAGNEISSKSRGKTKTSTGEPQSQDLVFVVEEKPHAVFKRDGNDLVCTLKVPLLEALTHEPTSGSSSKSTHKIQTLDNRTLTVSLPPNVGVIKPGTETRIKGEGMPIRKDGVLLTGANASKSSNGTGKGSGVQRGDLIVKWEVEFPERLTPAQREGLRKVLG